MITIKVKSQDHHLDIDLWAIRVDDMDVLSGRQDNSVLYYGKPLIVRAGSVGEPREVVLGKLIDDGAELQLNQIEDWIIGFTNYNGAFGNDAECVVSLNHANGEELVTFDLKDLGDLSNINTVQMGKLVTSKSTGLLGFGTTNVFNVHPKVATFSRTQDWLEVFGIMTAPHIPQQDHTTPFHNTMKSKSGG